MMAFITMMEHYSSFEKINLIDIDPDTNPDIVNELNPDGYLNISSGDIIVNMGKKKAVTLTHNGKFVDGICAGGAPKGVSAGRVQGKDGIFYFKNPTPNAENTTESSRTIDSQDDDEDEE